jgi:hypothetical protein
MIIKYAAQVLHAILKVEENHKSHICFPNAKICNTTCGVYFITDTTCDTA